MNTVLFLLGLLTLGGAAAALSLRNLVHCALSLSVAFAGLAGLYLCLGVQFVGLVQLLVYVGAVGILVIFAVLLTRGGGAEARPFVSASWYVGFAIAGILSVMLVTVFLKSPSFTGAVPHAKAPTVKQIGERLMEDYVIPLEAIGLLLTAAAIGAIVIAMPERKQTNS